MLSHRLSTGQQLGRGPAALLRAPCRSPNNKRVHVAAPGQPLFNERQDAYTSFVDYCGGLCTSAVQTVVARLSDLLQSIAPTTTPRHKVEISVKASLVLLALALLKGVLSAVLVVGVLGVAFYTATQVFGITGLPVGGAGPPPSWQPPPGAAPSTATGSSRPAAGGSQGPYGTAYTEQDWARWQQWQQAQQQQQQQPWPDPGPQQPMGWPSRQPGQQDDVLDVWYAPPRPK